jgi:hypothetical protein
MGKNFRPCHFSGDLLRTPPFPWELSFIPLIIFPTYAQKQKEKKKEEDKKPKFLDSYRPPRKLFLLHLLPCVQMSRNYHIHG